MTNTRRKTFARPMTVLCILGVTAAGAGAADKAKGPVKFFIPMKGWSSISLEGADLYEPRTDAGFAPALRKHLKPDIEVVEMETEFSSNEFTTALVDALNEMIKK